MAVQLMPGFLNNAFSSKLEKTAVQEAATAGLQSVEKLMRLISQSQHEFEDPLTKVNSHQPETSTEYVEVADAAVNKFKKFISLLDRPRTGHARFRKAPISPPVQDSTATTTSGSKVFCPVPVQRHPPLPRKDSFRTISFSAAGSAAPAAEAVSSGDSERSMSSGFQFTNLSQTSSAGKPPLSTSSIKRKCSSMEDSGGKCGGSCSSRCHCPKKSRKSKVKRIVLIPAISSKVADIPPDDFSWRKYGQKPIKGSPYPRGYYKCSSVKGCPALKHVEKSLDDPNMLIITYLDEHNHPFTVTDTAASLVLGSS